MEAMKQQEQGSQPEVAQELSGRIEQTQELSRDLAIFQAKAERWLHQLSSREPRFVVDREAFDQGMTDLSTAIQEMAVRLEHRLLEVSVREAAEPNIIGGADAFRFAMPDDSMAPTINKGEGAYCSPQQLEREGLVDGKLYLVESHLFNGQQVRRLFVDGGAREKAYGEGKTIGLGVENDLYQGVEASRREVKIVARVIGKVIDYA